MVQKTEIKAINEEIKEMIPYMSQAPWLRPSSRTPLRSRGFKSVRGPGRTKSSELNFSHYLKGRTSKTLWRCVLEYRTEK